MTSYKSVSPRTQLATYGPGVEVNWDLLHDGEAISPGSVYITGELKLTSTGLTNGTLEHFIDNYAGVGAFMENVMTRCDAYQEVISNYGRLCKHNAMMQYSPDQMCVGTNTTSELRAPTVKMAGLLADSAATAAWSFAHKPLIALNNMSGPLGSSKSGRVQISFKCPSVQKAIFGANAADITTYAFSNLQLHYKTTADANAAVVINCVQDTQKLIQSSRTTIMNTFPDPVNKVLVSFADTDVENQPTQNSLVCQFPPISKASWVYNDVSNSLVAYDIETQEELVLSGLQVMKAAGTGIDIRDQMAMAALDPAHSVNDKFALGLVLGGNMDFSRTGLGVTVELDQGAAAQQYYAYFYAYGQKTI